MDGDDDSARAKRAKKDKGKEKRSKTEKSKKKKKKKGVIMCDPESTGSPIKLTVCRLQLSFVARERVCLFE